MITSEWYFQLQRGNTSAQSVRSDKSRGGYRSSQQRPWSYLSSGNVGAPWIYLSSWVVSIPWNYLSSSRVSAPWIYLSSRSVGAPWIYLSSSSQRPLDLPQLQQSQRPLDLPQLQQRRRPLDLSQLQQRPQSAQNHRHLAERGARGGRWRRLDHFVWPLCGARLCHLLREPRRRHSGRDRGCGKRGRRGGWLGGRRRRGGHCCRLHRLHRLHLLDGEDGLLRDRVAAELDAQVVGQRRGLVTPEVDEIGAVHVGGDGERVEDALGRLRVAGGRLRVARVGVDDHRVTGTVVSNCARRGVSFVAHTARAVWVAQALGVQVFTAGAAAGTVVPFDGAVLTNAARVTRLARARAAVARAVAGAGSTVDAETRRVVTGAHLPSGPT